MIDSVKQAELDMFEEQILDALFGGHQPEFFELGKGFFTVNIANEIQQVINRFEQTVLPFMDSQGRIDGVLLKNKLPVKWANIIPDNKFRLVDTCSDILLIIQYLKGVFIK